jgi:tellurite resistance protein
LCQRLNPDRQPTPAILWSREEVARRANEFYESSIREIVETDENIGKMIIIDAETGDYAIGQNDIKAVETLRQENPNAQLFGIRVGYDVAVALGGAGMERTKK